MNNSALEIAYNEQAEAFSTLQEENDRLNRVIENRAKADLIAKQKGLQKQSRKKVHFTRINITETRHLIEKKILSNTQKAVLFTLAVYLDFGESGMVVDSRKKIPLNLANLEKVTNLKRTQLRTIINELAQIGVLEKIEYGNNVNVKLNPIYISRGAGKPPKYTQ